MATTNSFQSITEAGTAYKTKRGNEFRAQFRGFTNLDSKVQAVGDRFAVKNFVNISGSKDLINKALEVEFEESAFEGRNGTVHSIPANITIWVNTEAEANAVAEQLSKNTQISAPVRVHAREYKGNLYLELDVDTLFVHPSSGGGGSMAPAAGKKSAAETAAEDDLPF